jgi:nicotinate dehydrogenase subunit B
MNDAQIIELVSYLRKQFAPDKPAWADVSSSLTRIKRAAN